MQKKLIITILIVLVSVLATNAQTNDWPILKHYDQNHLLNVALPLGGIGTGTVSLGGRGELRDWQIMNRPGVKFSTTLKGNNVPYFAV